MARPLSADTLLTSGIVGYVSPFPGIAALGSTSVAPTKDCGCRLYSLWRELHKGNRSWERMGREGIGAFGFGD